MIEILLLALAVMINNKPDRVHACLVIMWIMIVNQAIYNLGPFELITGLINFHVYNSLFELLVIVFLSFNRSALSYQCMGLACVSILVNILIYWFDLMGANTYSFFDAVMYALFGVQLILLYSERISDGLSNYVARWVDVHFDPDIKHQNYNGSD